MGNTQAAGYAEAVSSGLCDLDAALTAHLRSNHYPPLPLSLLPVAKEAIEYANEGDYRTLLQLPDGVSYRGATLAPVAACVEAWHLDAFIQGDDDGEGWDA